MLILLKTIRVFFFFQISRGFAVSDINAFFHLLVFRSNSGNNFFVTKIISRSRINLFPWTIISFSILQIVKSRLSVAKMLMMLLFLTFLRREKRSQENFSKTFKQTLKVGVFTLSCVFFSLWCLQISHSSLLVFKAPIIYNLIGFLTKFLMINKNSPHKLIYFSNVKLSICTFFFCFFKPSSFIKQVI